MRRNLTFANVVLLIITFAIYSCSSVFSKSASMYEFLSLPYMMFFCGVMLALMLYAILWQKVLAFMPLNKAFLFKSITIVMIIAISHLLFGEVITLNNMIGAGFIIGGIMVLSWEN